jgi:gentisate 1,2-dioxygenase
MAAQARRRRDMTAVVDRIQKVSTLEQLYGELGGMDMTPGWIPRQEPILWAEPNTAFRPAHWRYSEVKPALDAAGRLIDTKLAERRNLVMRNPADSKGVATTRTLVSAYQMILPGEKARSHRHAPHALRVIIDAEGAYSTVQGEKTPMETGDIVLTPGWYWHGHGHDGDRPAYWYDGLDVPLMHLLEPMFYEDHPDGFEEVERVSQDSPFRFTWDGTQAALDRAERDPEGVHGRRIQLDSSTMPTMGLYVHRFETGERTRRHRSTDNAIFCAMQGEGRTIIEGQTIAWKPGDTFCAPCWKWTEHRADSDAVLFHMTDEPLQRFAKFYRFELD